MTWAADGTAEVSSTNNGTPTDGNIATTAGTYQWIAEYSGNDQNEAPDATSCNDEREANVVTASVPDVETELHAPDHTVIANNTALDLGSKVHDSGTVTGPAALGTPDGTSTSSSTTRPTAAVLAPQRAPLILCAAGRSRSRRCASVD